MKSYRSVWVVAMVLLLGACNAFGSGKEEPFRLKVALYPWVPNAESFMNWIEQDFESRNPGIELVVRPWKLANDEADLSYDYDKATEALTTEGEDSQPIQHIIEIDTMTLGKLIEAGAIQKFEVDGGVSFLGSVAEKGEKPVRQANWCECSR